MKPGKVAFADVYFWSLAELATLGWLFFEDVDFVESPGRSTVGFLLFRHPRRKLRMEDLKEPDFLKKKEARSPNS